MKYKVILFYTFCIIIHLSVLAQTDEYYLSHMKEVLDNSYSNRSSISCVGTDSILNYDILIPELSSARIYFKEGSEPLGVFGTICFADIYDSIVVICLRNLPCCDGNMVSYLWCHMAKLQNAKMDTICKMSYTTATTLPQPADYKPNSIILNLSKSTELRSSPILDDDSVYYELRQQGNVVASLRNGAEIYVIASQYHDASLWYFVAVKNNNSVSEAFSEQDDNYVFGWLLDSGFFIQKTD